MTPLLSGLLDSIKDEKKVSLAVADPKLGKTPSSPPCRFYAQQSLMLLSGNAINKLSSINLTPISDSTTSELYRAIRSHLPALIPGLLPQDISTMSLGLSHSLSRHKLKFSPDKVDTMIVQAIALLDDLDKELNTYAMRVKEWYGWHFPEMGRIVNDNLAYAKVILQMGMRTSAATTDLAEVLPEDIETAVKAAAEVSMGTEITAEDLDNIQALADQVVNFTEYRQQLSSYLSARMTAIAPNLTSLVGELVGARLIAHAGSLMNLAKSPASTIQILGAEKALFRALKTKHDTPKYGLIYHASLIGQATGKNKGKMARMLATKTAIGVRVDALAEWSAHGEGKGDQVTEEEKAALGIESRAKLERRLRMLEGKSLPIRGSNTGPVTGSTPGKWEMKEVRKYNPDADGLAADAPTSAAPLASKALKEAKNGKANMDREGDIQMTKTAEAESDDSSEDNEATADTESEDQEEGTVDEPVPSAKPGKTAPNGSSSTPSLKKADKKQQSTHDDEIKNAKKAHKAEKLAKKHGSPGKPLETTKPMQDDQGGNLEVEQHSAAAEKAGLSVTRYKRKLERGEITFGEDGTPIAISKKDIKKAKKEAEKSQKVASGEEKKKRKRESEGGEKVEVSRKEKKKKTKSKE